MNRLLLTLAGLLIAGLALSGCSRSEEITDKAATNLVNRIKTPIDDARAVSDKVRQTRD